MALVEDEGEGQWIRITTIFQYCDNMTVLVGFPDLRFGYPSPQSPGGKVIFLFLCTTNIYACIIVY